MAVADAAYKFYSERTAFVILLFFSVGGVIVWLSTLCTGAWSSAFLSLGMSMISLGAFSTASEYFLKTALTDDLLARTQMRAEVAASGFSWVRAGRDVPWAEIFSSAKEVDCIVKSPEAFKQSIWPHLMAAAKARTLRLQIFLCAEPAGLSLQEVPDVISATDADAFRSFEQAEGSRWQATGLSDLVSSGIDGKLDTGSATYRIARELEDLWKSAKSDNAISSKCELHIAVVQEPTECAIFSTTDRQLILLGPPSGSYEDGTAMLFEKSGGESLTSEWASSLIRRYAKVGSDVWTDMKKKGDL